MGFLGGNFWGLYIYYGNGCNVKHRQQYIVLKVFCKWACKINNCIQLDKIRIGNSEKIKAIIKYLKPLNTEIIVKRN